MAHEVIEHDERQQPREIRLAAVACSSGTTSVLARNVARCGYGSGISRGENTKIPRDARAAGRSIASCWYARTAESARHAMNRCARRGAPDAAGPTTAHAAAASPAASCRLDDERTRLEPCRDSRSSLRRARVRAPASPGQVEARRVVGERLGKRRRRSAPTRPRLVERRDGRADREPGAARDDGSPRARPRRASSRRRDRRSRSSPARGASVASTSAGQARVRLGVEVARGRELALLLVERPHWNSSHDEHGRVVVKRSFVVAFGISGERLVVAAASARFAAYTVTCAGSSPRVARHAARAASVLPSPRRSRRARSTQKTLVDDACRTWRAPRALLRTCARATGHRRAASTRGIVARAAAFTHARGFRERRRVVARAGHESPRAARQQPRCSIPGLACRDLGVEHAHLGHAVVGATAASARRSSLLSPKRATPARAGVFASVAAAATRCEQRDRDEHDVSRAASPRNGNVGDGSPRACRRRRRSPERSRHRCRSHRAGRRAAIGCSRSRRTRARDRRTWSAADRPVREA